MGITYYATYSQTYKVGDSNDPGLRAAIIKDLINDNKSDDIFRQGLWNRYMQETGALKIDGKEAISTSKANNKLKHDFRGEIVDTQSDYAFGVPISYNIDDEQPDMIKDRFRAFIDDNDYSSNDNELAKRIACCGHAGRLYYQQNTKLWSINLFPWEYKIIYDTTTGKPMFGIRYFQVVKTGSNEAVTQVEFYDERDVEFYTEISGEYYLDVANIDVPETKKPHGFLTVPLADFRNNPIKKGDFEKVEVLVDAYDLIASLNMDDIEELRDAYLFIKGIVLSEEQRRNFKKYHMFDTMDEQADMKYVVKNLNPEAIKADLERLKNDIYRISQTVNFGDEHFSGGSQSGESRKYKLMSMENRRSSKVASFKQGLETQFEIISTGWYVLHGYQIDPAYIYYDFTPNIPIDLLYWAEVATKLKGIVSDETILDILPSTIVPDTAEEKGRIQAEREGLFSLMDLADEPEQEETE